MSFVQSNPTFTNSSVTSLTNTLTGVVVGNLLFAFVFWNSPTFTPTVSDDKGNVWTAIGARQVGAAGFVNYSAQCFYAKVTTGGSVTLTVNMGGANFVNDLGIALHEYSASGYNGLTLNPSSGYASSTPGVSGTTVTSASITCRSGDLVIAGIVCGDVVSAAGAGYSLRCSGAGFEQNGTEDRAAAASSVTATFTSTSAATTNIVWIVSFTGKGLPAPPARARRVLQRAR